MRGVAVGQDVQNLMSMIFGKPAFPRTVYVCWRSILCKGFRERGRQRGIEVWRMGVRNAYGVSAELEMVILTE